MKTDKNSNNKEKTSQEETTVEHERTTTHTENGNEMPAEDSSEEQNTPPANTPEQDLALLQDKHLRLVAEYDNYRKRTMKEKADLLLNGGERVLGDLLPVIDDIELALKNIQTASDVTSLREGVELIYSKFIDYLQKHGVKPIEAIGAPFNGEEQQAIAVVPAPTPEQKGQVIDCVKTGYTLNGKVLRFADVVVGE